jgi:hypothetical protein
MNQILKCPKCSKANLEVETNFGGFIFKRKKRITYYCPLCTYKNEKVFIIKEEEYQSTINKSGEYF